MQINYKVCILYIIFRPSTRHTSEIIKGAICVQRFDDSLGLRIALLIAFCHVLHRHTSRVIHRSWLCITFLYSIISNQQSTRFNKHKHADLYKNLKTLKQYLQFSSFDCIDQISPAECSQLMHSSAHFYLEAFTYNSM